MAASAMARVIACIFVALQSYLRWSPDDLGSHIPEGYIHGQHHLAGVILARGGSKGIPKKNIANLNGKPLIHWALKAMIDSKVFTTIWVSTDDAEISTWMKQYPQVNVHSRAKYTATDEAESIVGIQELLSLHPEIDAIGLIQATSPFIRPQYLKQAQILLKTHDSVFSATKSKALRWTASEPTKAINFDPKFRPRRQDWDGEMLENGMFYFSIRDIIMNDNVFQGPRTTFVEIPNDQSLEIDTPIDLKVAECLMDLERLDRQMNAKMQIEL